MDETRVLIIADDPLARAGLASILATRSDCAVVGQTAGDGDIGAALDVYRPDVLLWDIGWEGDTIPDWLSDLGDGRPKVVVLLPDEDSAGELWTAGARGLLLRSSGPERIAAAIRAAAEGLITLDPALSNALPSASPAAPVEALTPRESEVLHLLAEGLTNKAIARRLDISDHTVKFHINAILSKLHAQSRTEAVVIGLRMGLISL